MCRVSSLLGGGGGELTRKLKDRDDGMEIKKRNGRRREENVKGWNAG